MQMATKVNSALLPGSSFSTPQPELQALITLPRAAYVSYSQLSSPTHLPRVSLLPYLRDDQSHPQFPHCTIPVSDLPQRHELRSPASASQHEIGSGRQVARDALLEMDAFACVLGMSFCRGRP